MPSGGQFLSIEVTPDLGRADTGFNDWAGRITDWGPAWRDIVTLFRRHEKGHLDSEGAQTGPDFPPLSTRSPPPGGYEAWKDKRYPGLPILQREKVLFRALTEGGQGSIDKRTKTSLRVGINPNASLRDPGRAGTYNLGEAAKAHATGDGVPVRPPVRFDESVQNRSAFGYAVAQILQAHIVKARREALTREIEAAIGGPAPPHRGPDKTIAAILSKKWR